MTQVLSYAALGLVFCVVFALAFVVLHQWRSRFGPWLNRWVTRHPVLAVVVLLGGGYPVYLLLGQPSLF